MAGCDFDAVELTPQANETDSVIAEPQPVDTNYVFTIDEAGNVSDVSISTIPEGNISSIGAGDAIPQPTPSRLHPRLQEKLSNLSGTNLLESAETAERVIVSFEDRLETPRFATLRTDVPLDSPEARTILTHNEKLVEQLKQARSASYSEKKAQLTKSYGAKIVDEFWLIDALVIEIPLKSISGLLSNRNITYIEPEIDGSPPPQSRDVAGGRARINSDWYFNQVGGGFIALLDTGVRRTHTQFNDGSGSRIRNLYNCLASGPCNPTPDPSFDDPCSGGHGTSSAAILSANDDQGNRYRGVTRRRLDVYRVYPDEVNCGLNTTAAVKAFEHATAQGTEVIVAEMQGVGGFTSSIPTAADKAYNAGIVVIAANGNSGPSSGTVRAPANAHKVLGVGSYDIISSTTPSDQSRGPTSDGRIKPDIQAPTCTLTASSASDTAIRTSCYNGTSGATPYAAGAAALVGSYFRQIRSNVAWTPGQIYSYIISSGSDPYPFGNVMGAGRLRLHSAPSINAIGYVNISQGERVNVQVPLKSSVNYTRIRGAIWWGEGVSTHNNINLYLVDASGTVHASSTDVGSVFEMAQVANPASGNWYLRIVGTNVGSSSVRVYYSGISNF